MNKSKFLIWVFFLILTGGLATALPPENGKAVVVVYNSRMPESKEVAEYYARKRQVPANQVHGFSLPVEEAITRQDYLNLLEEPLYKMFETNHWFTFGPMPEGAPAHIKNARKVIDASIRYVVLCYGVPTRILKDPKLSEAAESTFTPALRRNEASVDSQLAVIPALEQKPDWVGPLKNPIYGVTNGLTVHPKNNVLMVARLDGPSSAIARGLVDKAMEAEANGLWGRAYFDARGLTNGDYVAGDNWMRAAANVTRILGFQTEVDEQPGTFTAAQPMSHIAFYSGWYDENVSGPFARPQVEFMPGAFAYHLHSFNAATIRTTNSHWTGPLLAKGVTCTIGSVDEPYLQMTPDLAVFYRDFLAFGFTFGEAAYACQQALSWQNIVIGDPLYRPFGKDPKAQHEELQARGSPLLDWSVLRWVNVNLARPEVDLAELIRYLEEVPLTPTSPVLKERLADLYLANKKITDALDTYELVLKLKPSPQQKLRVLLTLAQKRTLYGRNAAALETYKTLIKEYPDFPGLLELCKKALPIAQKLGQKEAIQTIEQEIKRLTPAGDAVKG
ncbi:MAG TPA: TIGR03790 family protein [Candidatus Saccharimonadales bacterium]|nr:TIGR03790 family protein [Candidatus Saccharimonadales bacterium]